MDYEKRYKKALERAKKLYGQGTITESLCFVFPELKESEDERIRKWLIGYFQQYRIDGMEVVYADSLKVDDILAWLEKQKHEETKEPEEPEEVVFRPTAGCNIDSAARQVIEKQKVSEKDIVLAFNGAYIPVYNKTKDEIVAEYHDWIKKQDEQKPTIWSEEDEQSKNWILEYLHDGLRKTDEQFKGQFKTAIAWLERQKHVDKEELKKGALKYVARQFMKWLDAKIPNDKMCLSNMECKDIEDAFLKDDWARISHYMRKKLDKQGKTLDPDKVIEWINNQACLGFIEDIEVEKFVEQFKKDFGL